MKETNWTKTSTELCKQKLWIFIVAGNEVLSIRVYIYLNSFWNFQKSSLSLSSLCFALLYHSKDRIIINVCVGVCVPSTSWHCCCWVGNDTQQNQESKWQMEYPVNIIRETSWWGLRRWLWLLLSLLSWLSLEAMPEKRLRINRYFIYDTLRVKAI